MPDCQKKYNRISRLKLEQVRLWDDHYYLTRQVIRDAVDASSCLSIDVNTLYLNQDRLGENFGKLTYRKSGGKKLALLLREHITIAIQIVEAAIAERSINTLYKKWQINGSKIAKVYHHYNHRIVYKKINKFMQQHLETTLAEAVAIIQKDCVASTKTGEIALHHIHMMADYINSKFDCQIFKCKKGKH